MGMKFGKVKQTKPISTLSTVKLLDLAKSDSGKNRAKAKVELDKRVSNGLKLDRYQKEEA